MNIFQFSGHETFPLRQLWLMKAVREAKNGRNHGIEQAMVSLGVGKNMVSSIRFWAKATEMLDSQSSMPTQLANLIFGTNEAKGLDPYGESLNTAWLAHWNLTKSAKSLTTFWYIFNFVNQPTISRSDIQEEISNFVESHNCKVSEISIKRDIEVFFRSYVPNATGRNKKTQEEFVEPLLGDLNLMKALNRDTISIYRSEKMTLPNALFAYCLLDFWTLTSPHTATLDFTKIMHDVGSPGKVFRLSENAIIDRLHSLEELTSGELLWTEQAGVRTVLRQGTALNNPQKLMFKLLKTAYQ